MELSIALEKPCYFPGEVLTCLIKIRRANDATGAASAALGGLQLLFECSGSERVDPSWVGHLYKPEVTAIKDNRRLVRSIFSTGQVPLATPDENPSLTVAREFVVRCRLPNRLPPSYRGNAVRFVYQVVVQAKVQAPGQAPGTPQKQQHSQSAQQQQQQTITCQSQSSFVVWPMAERSSSLDRRASIQQPPHGQQGAAAAAGAASAAAAVDSLQDTEMIDYKLGMQVAKLRWEEVLVNADGTRTLMAHQPSMQLYPALTSQRSSMGSQLLAAQLCSLDSVLLDDHEAAVAGVAAAGDDEGGQGFLRHLTPAQRASMAVRTFNLRAGDFPLARLVLQPPSDGLLQPGGTFGLLLDMRAAHAVPAGSSLQPVCLQAASGGFTVDVHAMQCLGRVFKPPEVVALLESEEVVLAPHTHARSCDSAAMRKLYAEQQEVTAHLLTSQFVFSIPLTAPPSFKTPMVSHRWLLRFELTLGKPKPNKPGEFVTEQLLWSLPLIVFPPPPQSIMGM